MIAAIGLHFNSNYRAKNEGSAGLLATMKQKIN